MKGKILVSIIIPTYNRMKFLKEALDSVIGQTVSDIELIVVDDGSKDNTERVVRSFSRTNYYRLPENRGVSFARNFGILQASGRYICFLDSDDQWLPDKLITQIQFMEKNLSFQVCYTDEIWIRHGVRVNPMKKHRKFSGDIFRHCLPRCIVSPSSVMIRSGFFADVGIFDETLPACEDYDLWLRMSLRVPFHFIDRKLIIKRGGHKDQLSRKYWGMDRFRVQALEKILGDNRLKGENRLLVKFMLKEKYNILYKGFLKRDKNLEAEQCKNLIEKVNSFD